MDEWKQFFLAALRHWMTYLGAFLFFVGVISRFRQGKWGLSNRLFLWIAIPFLFLACFAVWHDEQQKCLSIRQRLETEIKEHSGLHGTIEGLYRYKIPNMPGTLVFIELQVVNRGKPTYAENYYLHVKCAKTNLFCNELNLYPPIDLPAANGLPQMIFTTNDALYFKTLDPIAQGAQKRGWLFYQITNATWDELADTNDEWVISYDDDTQKRYYVTNNNSLLTSRGEVLNMPGAESPVAR